MIHISAKYCKGDMNVHFATYAKGGKCISLHDPNGELVCRATVCLPDHNLQAGCVWLKGWGENEGVPVALEKAGVVQLIPLFAQSGYVIAQMAKVL